jgi:hypothetical protein
MWSHAVFFGNPHLVSLSFTVENGVDEREWLAGVVQRSRISCGGAARTVAGAGIWERSRGSGGKGDEPVYVIRPLCCYVSFF